VGAHEVIKGVGTGKLTAIDQQGHLAVLGSTRKQ
jgi:hypothetical protein